MGELVVLHFSDTSAQLWSLISAVLGMLLGTPKSFPRKVTAVLQFPKMFMCMDPARCTDHVLRTPVWEIRDKGQNEAMSQIAMAPANTQTLAILGRYVVLFGVTVHFRLPGFSLQMSKCHHRRLLTLLRMKGGLTWLFHLSLHLQIEVKSLGSLFL